jgi:hypothetical protein
MHLVALSVTENYLKEIDIHKFNVQVRQNASDLMPGALVVGLGRVGFDV